MKFLELLENDPLKLTEITHAGYATRGGLEGSEVTMWLVMRGALSASVRKVHQSYYLPSMTALATAIYVNQAEPPSEREVQDHLDHMGHQLAGVEKLEVTYPYTLERSHKGYRLNDFLHSLIKPAQHEAFLADQEKLFAESSLTTEECDMIRKRDWQALIRYGASFLVLEKLGAVAGVSNPQMYAHARREFRGLPENPQRPATVFGCRWRQGEETVRQGRELINPENVRDGFFE